MTGVVIGGSITGTTNDPVAGYYEFFRSSAHSFAIRSSFKPSTFATCATSQKLGECMPFSILYMVVNGTPVGASNSRSVTPLASRAPA
jgi:hypothetical protein